MAPGIILERDEPGGREAYAERFRSVAAELVWERALDPLVRFCAAPRPAPDRVANLGRFQTQMEGVSERQRTAGRGGLLAPAPTPTPLLALPLRALTYLRVGGLPRLWREARSYLRWLRIRGAD